MGKQFQGNGLSLYKNVDIIYARRVKNVIMKYVLDGLKIIVIYHTTRCIETRIICL